MSPNMYLTTPLALRSPAGMLKNRHTGVASIVPAYTYSSTDARVAASFGFVNTMELRYFPMSVAMASAPRIPAVNCGRHRIRQMNHA